MKCKIIFWIGTQSVRILLLPVERLYSAQSQASEKTLLICYLLFQENTFNTTYHSLPQLKDI